ncbi:MAG: hypothetical protein SFX19_02915 [Alphaproteobacteria bacterium]|nr:hypothetical protein [Alphaproteobacteria bacterium]
MRFEHEVSHDDPAVQRLISHFPELAQADRDGRRYHFFIEHDYGSPKRIMVDAVEMKWTMLEKLARVFHQAAPKIGKDAREHVLSLDYEAVKNPDLPQPSAHVATVNTPLTLYHYSKMEQDRLKHFLVVEKEARPHLRIIAKEYQSRAGEQGADFSKHLFQGVIRDFIEVFSRFSLSQQKIPENVIADFLKDLKERGDVQFIDLGTVSDVSQIPALIAKNREAGEQGIGRR